MAFTGAVETDAWIMLGDNAYDFGTDAEYQAAVFDTYPQLLRKTFLWPTIGNHDAASAHSGSQTGPYYDIFTLPTDSGAPAMPSMTEAYYSWDLGNVHFVVLDSQGSSRHPSGPMLTWAEADLDDTLQDWVIAYWHHPPYTRGSHNSDSTNDSSGRLWDMRVHALPIFEAGGVDLVLTGHSHVYERSILLDGHYGTSLSYDPNSHAVDEGDGCRCIGARPEGPFGGDGAYQKPALGPSPNEGAVYAVVGSSSIASGILSLDHPVMAVALREEGALVLDIDGARLEGTWIQKGGTMIDRFTLIKGSDADLDGILDDGDGSGDPTDSPCTGGQTAGCDDNCPFRANPLQEDDGGVSPEGADGIGNACQCGDMDGDGSVGVTDMLLYRRRLTGLTSPFSTDRCSVAGEPDGNCGTADLVVLRRTLAGLTTGVLENLCPARLGLRDPLVP